MNQKYTLKTVLSVIIIFSLSLLSAYTINHYYTLQQKLTLQKEMHLIGLHIDEEIQNKISSMRTAIYSKFSFERDEL